MRRCLFLALIRYAFSWATRLSCIIGRVTQIVFTSSASAGKCQPISEDLVLSSVSCAKPEGGLKSVQHCIDDLALSGTATMADNQACETGQVSRIRRQRPENEMLEQKVQQLREEVVYLKNTLAEHKCRPACVKKENSRTDSSAEQVE